MPLVKPDYLAARTFWSSESSSWTSPSLTVFWCFSMTGFSLSRIRARSSGKEGLSLFDVPGAGYDAVDLAAFPASGDACN